MLKMGYRRQLLFLFITTVIGTVILFILTLSWETLCLKNRIFEGCYEFGNGVVGPTLFFCLCILVSLLPLLFLKEAVYKSWRNFAMIYIPIAIVLIMASPEYSDGFLGGGWSMTPAREETTMWLSGLFLFISLILITYKSLKLRGK